MGVFRQCITHTVIIDANTASKAKTNMGVTDLPEICMRERGVLQPYRNVQVQLQDAHWTKPTHDLGRPIVIIAIKHSLN